MSKNESDKTSWRPLVVEKPIGAHEVEMAFNHAPRHPISSDVLVLKRFESVFADRQKLNDEGFAELGMFLTDIDPQVPMYIRAAFERRCFNVRLRAGTALEAFFRFIRERPALADSRTLQVWNDQVRTGKAQGSQDYVLSFDLWPFAGHLERVKEVLG